MPHHLKSPKIYVFILSLIIAFLLSFPLSFIFKRILNDLSYFKNRRTIKLLREENLELKKEILRLKSILPQKDLIEENKRLKKMLSLKEKYSNIVIPALILNKNPWSWEKEVLIDKGKKDGITEGSLVIDFQANLVGKIEKVEGSRAWIKLITDPNFKIIVNCKGLNTLLVGALYEGAKLLYVPYDFPIENKDKITISKNSFTIRVGQVSFIEKERSSLTQNIFVRPYLNLNNLKEVFIVKEE